MRSPDQASGESRLNPRAEDGLPLAQESYRMLVERMAAVTYVQEIGVPDPAAYMSPQIETLTGYTPEECMQPGLRWSMVHPEDREWMQAEDRTTAEVGEVIITEYRVLHRDGRTVWVRNESVIVEEEDGARYWQGLMVDVTERKEAEEALRSSEERYRMIARSIDQAIWDDDMLADQNVWSGGFEATFGYSQDLVTDEAWWKERVHPADRQRMEGRIGAYLAGGETSWTEEYRFRRADGSYAVVEDRVVCLRDADGRPVRMIGAMMDVTQRKEAEEALRRSEEQFRSLVRNSSDIITVASEDGTVRYVSPAIEPILGYRPEERTGRSAYELLHPEDVPGARRVHEKLLRNPGMPIRYEARMRHNDGSWRHIEAVLANRLAEPSVEGLVINWRDTTERVQALRAQRESEERYRLAALATNEVVWFSDILADRQTWDGTFEQTLGYPQNLQTTKAWWKERIHPEDRERVVGNAEAWLRGGDEIWTEEYRFRRADGSYATVVDRAMVVRDAGGRPVRMAGSIMDITERRQAEESLHRSEERYRLVARAIDEAIWDNDIVADRQIWDGAFEATFGYPQDLVTDEAWWKERVHPADRKRMVERIDGLLAGDETSWTEEYRFRRADGSYAVVEDRAMFVRDVDGRPVRMIGAMMDVTEYRRVEEEVRHLNANLERQIEERTAELKEALDKSYESEKRLSRSTARFRSLVRHASDVITIIDAEGVIRYTSATKDTVHGYSSQALLGKRASEYVHPEDLQRNQEVFSSVLERAGSTTSDELRYLASDGSWRDLEVVYTNLLHDESVSGIVVNSRDVTDRKRAQSRLWAQYAVTRALDECSSLQEAADEVLKIICQGLRWDVGSVFLSHRREEMLRCFGIWHAPSLELPGYEAATWDDTLDPSRALIGRVWASGEPLWIPDVAEEEAFARRSVAVEGGLHSAVMIPILVRGKAVGVLEFLARERRQPEAAASEMMTAVGGQIGQFIERRRAEEELRESEERLRATFEQAAVGVGRCDLDGTYIDANQKLCDMLGYTREELVGMAYENLTLSSEIEVDAELTRQLFARERSNYFREKPFVRQDGTVIWTNHAVSLVRDAGGQPLEFLGLIQDITERRRIEEARRQSESLYRAVVEQAAENIFIVDVETKRIIEANPALQESLGYSEAELKNLTLYDIVDHERKSVDRNVGRVLSRQGYALGDRCYRRKDGTRVEVEVNASVVTHKGRQAMCVVAHDVTERKVAEDNWRHSLSVLLALYEAGQVLTSSLEFEQLAPNLLDIMRRVASLSAAVIYLRDETGALRAHYARGPEEAWSVASATPQAREARAKASSAEGPVPFHPVPSRVGLSGAQKPASGAFAAGLCLPLRVLDRVVGVLEVYGTEDLRERSTVEVLTSLAGQAGSVLENARLYSKLTAREKQLEELIGKLISTQEEERRRVSYEVHDGLAQVAASAHQRLQAYAWRHPPQTEEAREDLERVLELVRHTVGEARKVIADLRPTVLDDLGLAAAINQKVDELRSEGWRVDYEERLEDERLPIAVETALYRVTQEALTNARKHAQTERVSVKLYRENGVVTLRIQDTGQGFDVRDTGYGAGPGERVGLSGMRERISMIGGEIEVRSKFGKGTSITVRVPTEAVGARGAT